MNSFIRKPPIDDTILSEAITKTLQWRPVTAYYEHCVGIEDVTEKLSIPADHPNRKMKTIIAILWMYGLDAELSEDNITYFFNFNLVSDEVMDFWNKLAEEKVTDVIFNPLFGRIANNWSDFE